MTGWRLKTYVHAVEVDSAGIPTGRAGGFGPDDQVPDWAVVAITNPDVWESEGSRESLPARPDAQHQAGGRQPAADAGQIMALRSRIAELEAHIATLEAERGGDSKKTDTAQVPPMRGPGSSAAEWRAYAGKVGVDVADDASRDDVVAALEAAGKPTK